MIATPLIGRGSNLAFRRDLRLVYAMLALLNIGGWGWALLAFYGQPALLGVAAVVYGLGLRHAVDADHIAAIDNVTRKFMAENRPAVAVGFWFAIGHSLVVIVVTAVVVTATSNLSRLDNYRAVGGLFSSCISALFLFIVAGMNAVILANVVRALARLKRGGGGAQGDLDILTAGGGIMARLFRSLFRRIGRPWHMAPLGFLFGLSFDTATEVTLFGLSATQAAHGMPVAAALVFPVLFAAGMSLLDTSEGLMMVGAYGWTTENPERKLYYNLAITLISITVALFIGSIQVANIAVEQLGVEGAFAQMVRWLGASFNMLGLAIIVLFAIAWGASMLIVRRIERQRGAVMDQERGQPRTT